MSTTDKRRASLGRGLSSLLGDSPVAPGQDSALPTPASLPITALKPGRFQPRQGMTEDGLDDLARSISEQGILQPIVVRRDPDDPDDYEIVAGERRWRAAQRAGLHEVPVLLRDLSDLAACEIALVENLQREDLSPMDEAEGYQRLIDEFAHNQEDLARRVGKSRPHVTNTLRLLGLPASVQGMVRSGDLSAGHARTLIGIDDAEARASEIVQKGLNVRQAEQLARAGRTPRSARAATPGKDTDTIALERELSNRLGLTVEIKTRGGGGSLVIHYRTLDQLDAVLSRLAPDH